ncbi:unnamed protein product [Lepidochelys kempii]
MILFLCRCRLIRIIKSTVVWGGGGCASRQSCPGKSAICDSGSYCSVSQTPFPWAGVPGNQTPAPDKGASLGPWFLYFIYLFIFLNWGANCFLLPPPVASLPFPVVLELEFSKTRKAERECVCFPLAQTTPPPHRDLSYLSFYVI